MMSKDDYRVYFLYWKKYVRFAPILDELEIPRSNFSQFLRGSNSYALSPEKLEMIRNRMGQIFTDIQEEPANGKG